MEKCVFNIINVIANMSVDEQHDFLEGSFRKTIPKMLFNLIYKHKYFSLRTFNWAMNYFDYEPVKGFNPPPPITETALKKDILIISASEMKTLVRYLSMYIGDLIPENCPEWQLYILTRKIYYIISSGISSRNIIRKLQSVVQ